MRQYSSEIDASENVFYFLQASYRRLLLTVVLRIFDMEITTNATTLSIPAQS